MNQVSIPDENSASWQEQQDGVDQVSRPDADAVAWQEAEGERFDARQKLHDLGLPPDPPKVTTEDLRGLEPEGATPDKEALEKARERDLEWQEEAGVDAGKHAFLHAGGEAIEKYTEKAAKMAENLGEHDAAKTIEKIGGAGEVAGKALSKASTVALVVGGVLDMIESHLEAGRARNLATIDMHGAALHSSNQLIEDKFPQARPLNQRGIDQDKAAFEKWKNGIDDKLDDILKDMQLIQLKKQQNSGGIAIKEMDKALDDDMDKLKSKLGKVLEEGTVDLTNARMTVYYDPRNWDESKMGGASKP